MPFVLTEKDDEVQVDFKTKNGDFFILVGTIPAVIGEKIDALLTQTLEVLRAQMTGEGVMEATLKAKVKGREAALLICKYGIRGHGKLSNSSGKDIPCVTEKEEGTGFTILTEKTMELYIGNEGFLETVNDKMAVLKRVGIGRYKVEGQKCLDEAMEMGSKAAAPFLKELLKSSSSSTKSQEKNDKNS